MGTLRKLSYLALVVAFAQIVFGAIVRITGSGMGCGDHWPRCAGHWFPPLDRPDLMIEITHRYLAAAVTASIVALLALAYSRRRETGVSGTGGVLRPAALAALLVVIIALLGAATVKLALNPYIIVTHLSLAMALLAVLVTAAIRAGGFGVSGGVASTAPRAARAAIGAGVLAFAALVFGALTANVVGANASCTGFPWCRSVLIHGAPLWIHVTHRVIAFLLLFHSFGMLMASRKRGDRGPVRTAAVVAFSVVLFQIVVAAAMVEMHLPPAWRSMHQAVGTLVWLSMFTLASLANYSRRDRAHAA